MRHIVADKRSVILPHRDGGVVKRRQRVRFDVADFGSIAFQAVHDIADMFTVQLQEPAFDKLGGYFLPADMDRFPCGTADFKHQFHVAVQQVLVVGVPFQKNVIVDIF